MKRFVPMLLAALVGWVMVVAFFIPPLRSWQQTAEEWFQIIAAISLLYGGANLILHHLKRVSDQEAGWGYSLVTVLAFVVTVAVGLLKLGVGPSENSPRFAWSGPYQAEGSAFWWIFEYVMSPLVSTMFALLAFYVASAAFRAFRAKNTEAIVLLVTAFIVLLGRTYDGTLLTSFLPESLSGLTIPGMTMTIMSVFNTAGQRAIMIGIALGVAATSLRILLLQDRSYLGSGD